MAIDLERAAYIVNWCREHARIENLNSGSPVGMSFAVMELRGWKSLAGELIRRLTDAGLGAMVDTIDPKQWTSREKVVAALSRIADQIEREVPISVVSPEINHSTTDRTPCRARDFLFLKWSNEGDLFPAQIRDKWNDLSDAERKRIAPRCRKRIGPKDKGRSVVRRALSRAKLA